MRGRLRTWARTVKRDAIALSLAARDPRVPWYARALAVAVVAYALSPIDLIPEFIPVIGPLDDIVIVALALRYAGRQVPREVLLAAWPGEPRLIARLLGPTANDAAV